MVLSLLIFINTSKKGNAVEASYVKVILGCVLLALLIFFLEFVYAM